MTVYVYIKIILVYIHAAGAPLHYSENCPVELSISTAMDSPHHRNSDMTFWLTGECNHLKFEWPWIVKMLPHSYSMHLLNGSLYTLINKYIKIHLKYLVFFWVKTLVAWFILPKKCWKIISPLSAPGSRDTQQQTWSRETSRNFMG